MAELSQTRLKEILNYDPITGYFTWRVNRGGRIKAGDRAGWIYKSKSNTNYIQISVEYRKYLAHRLAWLYVHGEWPIHFIDHIDGNGLNNKLSNLRSATVQENNRNGRKSKINTSGHTGVYWNKKANKWHPQIVINYKKVHLGLFNDYFDAVCARKSAENKYGFHPNHGKIRE